MDHATVNYKLIHENAQAPVRGSNDAAGWDLHVAEILRDNEREFWVDTGVGFDIPSGLYGDLRARSSVSETGLVLANGAGVLDPDYRGSVQFRFYKIGTMEYHEYEKYTGEEFSQLYPASPRTYNVGERVGQLILSPYLNTALEETNDLTDTERGEGGFGSTGT